MMEKRDQRYRVISYDDLWKKDYSNSQAKSEFFTSAVFRRQRSDGSGVLLKNATTNLESLQAFKAVLSKIQYIGLLTSFYFVC